MSCCRGDAKGLTERLVSVWTGDVMQNRAREEDCAGEDVLDRKGGWTYHLDDGLGKRVDPKTKDLSQCFSNTCMEYGSEVVLG